MNAQPATHVDLPVDAATLGRTRAEVAETLHGWGVADVDDALLVVSELVGNAIRYGGRVVGVSLERNDAGVVISVDDASPLLPMPRIADADCGRGLQLVGAVSAAWGAVRRDGGKSVWALIRLP